ncbi:MAG TPA: alkaline phosphatase family protein [Planctomycetota bacterium]
MSGATSRLISPARAGALAGMFAWLVAYLQLALANGTGLAPLFALVFGLGLGLVAAGAGALVGLFCGLVRKGLTAAVFAVLLPLLALCVALGWNIASGEVAQRADLLIGPTVQAVSLAFIGGAACTLLVLLTGKGLRSGAISVLGTLLAGGLLAGDDSSSPELAEAAALTAELAAGASPRPTVVLALDGLDGRALERLLLEDPRRAPGAKRVEQFAELIRRGSRTPLETLRPTDTPVVWTTLATGLRPEVHDVRSAEFFRAKGTARPIVLDGLLAERPLRAIAARWPALLEGPRAAVAGDRKRRAFWEPAAQAGLPCVVIGWPLAAPLQAQDGLTIVSAEALAGTAEAARSGTLGELVRAQRQPAQLAEYRTAASDFLAPLEFPHAAWRDSMVQELVEMQQCFALTDAILGDGFDGLLVVYDDFLATAARAWWRWFEPEAAAYASAAAAGEELPENSLGAVLPSFYELADRQIGLLLGRIARPDYRVFVISAYGFRPSPPMAGDESALPVTASQRSGTPGVLLVAGPELQARAELGRVTALDVAPTLLHLLGVPVAQELDGRVLAGVFTREFRDANPPRSVRTYEQPAAEVTPGDEEL